MSNIIEISDLSDPGLDVFARLTEAQLRNRLEPEKGIFIGESAKVIRLALAAGYEPVSLLVERGQLAGQARDILDRCGELPVYTADGGLLAQLTGFHLSQGVLCALRRPPLPDLEELCAGAGRVAVLENLMDAANVGAVFRSAAALGVDAVVATPSCCDPLCRRAVRVSMGTIFQVPWTRMEGNASDWPQPGLSRLKQLGFQTVALALGETAIPIDDPRLRGAEKLAILLGTEGSGLTPATIAAYDYVARVPMSRQVDSLNVAAASAVAFWQLCPRIP